MPAPLEIIFKVKGMTEITRAANKASAAWSKVGTTPSGSRRASAGTASGRSVSSLAPGANTIAAKFASPSFSPASSRLTRIASSAGGGSSKVASVAGKIGSALLEGSEANPYTAAATAALAASTAIYKLADEASKASQKFETLKFATGSNGGTAARLATIGSSIGMSGEQIGGMSAALQERITTDPAAMATARRFGAYNIGRPYGNVDEGRNLLKVLEGIRKLSDPSDRIRTARTLGVEGASNYFNLSDQQAGKVQADAQTKSSIFTPQFGQDAADFQSSVARVADSIENVIGALGKPVMKDMADWFNSLADGLNGVANWLNEHQNIIKVLKDLSDASTNALVGNGKGVYDSLSKANDDLNSSPTDALDANTRAHQANTDAINQLNGLIPGIYGKGARLNAALGDGSMGGEYLRRGLEAGGFRLGAF